MSHVPGSPSDPSAPLQSTRTKLLIASLSVIALGAGAFLKPRAPATPLSAPKEHSAPLIEEEVQRRAPFRGFSGLQDLGRQLAAHTVAIPLGLQPQDVPVVDFARPPSTSGPAGFGIVVSPDGETLTHAAALSARDVLQIHPADGGAIDAQVIAFEPATGLVLLRAPSQTIFVPPVIAEGQLRAGALAAIAARWQGSDTVLPVFVTEVRGDVYRFSASGASVLPGMPIFTLDGEVVAIASGADRPAYRVRDAIDRLRAAVSAGRGNPPSLGLIVQPRAGLLADAFGTTGVIVSDVVEDGPAGAAGILPGDVLTRIAETPVDSVDAAQRAIGVLTPFSQVVVHVIRGRKPGTFTVNAGSAFSIAGRVGRDDREAAAFPEVGTLFSAAQVRAAGLVPGARVLAINGRPLVSESQAARELRRERSAIVLYVQQDNRRFFSALPVNP